MSSCCLLTSERKGYILKTIYGSTGKSAYFRIMVCEFSADTYANPSVLQLVARMPRGIIGNENLEKLYLVEESSGVSPRPIEEGCD